MRAIRLAVWVLLVTTASAWGQSVTLHVVELDQSIAIDPCSGVDPATFRCADVNTSLDAGGPVAIYVLVAGVDSLAATNLSFLCEGFPLRPSGWLPCADFADLGSFPAGCNGDLQAAFTSGFHVPSSPDLITVMGAILFPDPIPEGRFLLHADSPRRQAVSGPTIGYHLLEPEQQGVATFGVPGGYNACASATPARTSTWGRIKTSYR